MNTKNGLTAKTKKRYASPMCEVIPVNMESLMVQGSGNLPGGSTGHDMGGGDDDEPITMPAKQFNAWDNLESED